MPKSHIAHYYDPITLKKLFANALMIDIESNNEKVEIVRKLIGGRFSELAPGTNRYGCMGPDGYCHKIALDRRGIVDNLTEFRRSPAIEFCAPKAYECNGVVLIVEPVELISKEDFIANEASILDICAQLSKDYIFEDIGFASKNFCNWGIRENGDLVVLDTGYMIPRKGNEEAMLCPVCGHPLKYNSRYTGFRCSYSRCNTDFSFIDVYRRLNTMTGDDPLLDSIGGFTLPNFDAITDRFYNSNLLKGGHLYFDAGDEFEEGEEGDIGAPHTFFASTDEPVRVEDIIASLGENLQHGPGSPLKSGKDLD